MLGVRKKLENSKHAYSIFVSAGGNGLKAVFRVPADAAQHADSFRAVEKHVRELTGKQIDKSGRNPERLCFISYGPETYFNPGAQELEPLPEPGKPKFSANGNVDLSARQRIAAELLGAIDWQSETAGFVSCPGKHLHTTGDGARDCKIDFDGIPTLHCFHNSCRGILDGINRELRSRIGKAEAKSQPQAARKLQQLSTVSMMPIRFVDKPLFQADAFHLLVGKKNAGKGTFLSAIAARVTRGEWGDKRNVIWIAAGEDSLALDVRPRIEAASGDASRVYYPPFVPKLPTEVGLLQKWAEELGNVGLIVMDPVSGMAPGRSNSNLDSDVRPIISPLNDLADNLKCVVVGVRHLKKNAAGGALDSVLGSVDWINVPRAVLAIVREPDGEIRYVQVVAGNRVPCGSDSTGFRIIGADIVPGGEPVAKAEFIDGPGRDVDDLLSVDQEGKPMNKTNQAVIRMLDLLDQAGDGGMKQDVLFAQVAQELDMSELTVRNKAFFGILHDLGLVKSHKDGMHGGWTIKRSSLPRPREFCSNNTEE